MNISIKLDLSVNGAVLVPTNDQFNRIKKAVKDIIFDGVEDVDLRRGGKRGSRKHWKKEEEEMGMQLLKSGYKFADIANKLNRQFGNERTAKSVGIRLYLLGRKSRNVGVLQRVQETNTQNV